MNLNETTQAPQELATTEVGREGAKTTTAPAKTLRKRLVLLGALVLVGIVIAVPFCQFFASFLASMPEEIMSTERVIDAYLNAMANRDIVQAYALVSPSGDASIAYSDLQTLTQGNNYALFQGYREISLSNFQMTQVGPDKYAEITGNVLYEGDYVGEFSAVLLKANGKWKIHEFHVSVPPDKFGKGD
jgi:hypothetical protein